MDRQADNRQPGVKILNPGGVAGTFHYDIAAR